MKPGNTGSTPYYGGGVISRKAIGVEKVFTKSKHGLFILDFPGPKEISKAFNRDIGYDYPHNGHNDHNSEGDIFERRQIS